LENKEREHLIVENGNPACGRVQSIFLPASGNTWFCIGVPDLMDRLSLMASAISLPEDAAEECILLCSQ
jgi:hypothetical protein